MMTKFIPLPLMNIMVPNNAKNYAYTYTLSFSWEKGGTSLLRLYKEGKCL